MKERAIQPDNNPFSPRTSGYGTYDGTNLHSVYTPDSDMHTFHQKAHTYFREMVFNPDFACVAGRGVTKGKQYAFNAYPDMTASDTAEGVAHDLFKFKNEFGLSQAPEKVQLVSFIATFKEPQSINQIDGAAHMYQLLGNMHNHDKQQGFDWNPTVSRDIKSPNFGYSSGGDAFFITYLYPHASSEARRSEIPLVLFTAHSVLDKLKESNAFEKLKNHARQRQETIHPHSGNHGETNEFRQYALVDPDVQTQKQNEQIIYDTLGKCPFSEGSL